MVGRLDLFEIGLLPAGDAVAEFENELAHLEMVNVIERALWRMPRQELVHQLAGGAPGTGGFCLRIVADVGRVAEFKDAIDIEQSMITQFHGRFGCRMMVIVMFWKGNF